MTSKLPTPTHHYFLAEAQDLLKIIEQGVFGLRSHRTPASVHELMRAAHTLKGAAASVGLSAINNVAHVLEDIFRAFYNPEIEIDTEVEGLLFQGYECLRLLLTAQWDGSQVDESDVLNRTADIIARLQAKLGDRFDRDTPIPTSTELGFDMVQSMFEIGVTQRLEELSQAIVSQSSNLSDVLRSQTEIFLGLAESLELPGFAAIAQSTLTALERHPEAVQTIAQIAWQDFSQGRARVLAGDRQQGGTPSPQLQQFAGQIPGQTGNLSNTGRDRRDLPLTQVQASSSKFNAPLLPALINLLQTDIPLPYWLQRLKTWIKTSRKFPALPQPSTPSPKPDQPPVSSAWVGEDRLSDLPPTLPLEALLSNLEGLSNGISNSLSVVELNTPGNDLATDSIGSSHVTKTGLAANLQIDSNPWGIQDKTSEIPDLFPQDSSVAASSQPSAESFSLSSHLSSQPALTRVQSQTIPIQETCDRSYRSADMISFKSVTTRAAAATVSAPNVSVRVDLEKLERLNYLTSELLINQNQQTSQDNALRLMVQELLDRLQKHQQTIDELCSQGDRLFLSRQSSDHTNTEKSSTILQQFDELEMDRYSDIHILSRSTLNEVMELKSISEALDQTTQQFRRSLETQQRLLFMVGNDLTAIRMQPLEELFQRLTQVIQKLSTSHNKSVQIMVTGSQVLVDKTIVEKLYDPLLHLVRNAFDHGIERAEIRQTLGKPAIGRIEINAYHQGHHTVIEVRDDGPGIDLSRVAQRATELGWLAAEAIATTSESTLLSYLFEPGFSTVVQVSDLSGRGVGLDVVRSQVQSFRGTVAVSSVPQQGTTFSLQIPLSLTIAKLLVCQHQGISYALPIDAIEQIVSRPDSLTQVGQQQVLQWHKGDEEMTIVVHSLSDLVGDSTLPQTSAESQSGMPAAPSIVLVRTDAGVMGIRVEQVLGEQELVIRPFGRAIAPPPYVYGCCIVGSNQLALVIDVRTLFQQMIDTVHATHHSSSSTSTSFQSGSATISDYDSDSATQTLSVTSLAAFDSSPFARRSPRHFHILLIEDSLTLRQTLSHLLQQAGYQVSQAKDGLEGLTFLQKHPTVDLVLCDIEMPRMNGFEFLSQRHQHLSLAKIPVVMLTSRSRAKYRQFAIDLGAADFITKPYVDQDLLSTIHHLLVQL